MDVYGNNSLTVVISEHSRLTAEPEEVVNAFEQLHSHVVVDQSVLQHACLEAQVSDMLPHPALTALLIMPEIKPFNRSIYRFLRIIVFSHIALLSCKCHILTPYVDREPERKWVSGLQRE